MTSNPRRIAVFTGARAEYGLLYWLLREIQGHPDLELQLMVGGMHLSPEFGKTIDVIREDGSDVAESIEMLISGDSPSAIAKSMALGLMGAADALARLQPDLLVLLGDRYEVMAVAQAALISRIPIAHLHGGEASEGAIDEAIRHSVSKMAHLHFVAAEPFRHRVIQLGEHPDRVFTVGALGLDYLQRDTLLDRSALERDLGFSLDGPVLVVTYHPMTLSEEPPSVPMGQLLRAIDRFDGARVVMTYPNADTGGRAIIQQIDAFAAEHAGRVLAVPSLGSRRYLSLLAVASAVVGNSSSGLIEAPSLGVPTVNVGDRQRGRPKATSVIDCSQDEAAIAAAIAKAMSEEFTAVARGTANPYGGAGAATAIVDRLVATPLEGLLFKSFHDVEFET